MAEANFIKRLEVLVSDLAKIGWFEDAELVRSAKCALSLSGTSLREFVTLIHERTPDGEWIQVKHHPNGDWSVDAKSDVQK